MITSDKAIEKYCPTQSGTFTAYKPEFRTEREKAHHTARDWMAVPIEKDKGGVPSPKQFGGIMSTIGLLGYSQAKALMWGFSALAEADGVKIEVRIVEYEVKFDIKAKVIKE